jgi:hypothetical protein
MGFLSDLFGWAAIHRHGQRAKERQQEEREGQAQQEAERDAARQKEEAAREAVRNQADANIEAKRQRNATYPSGHDESRWSPEDRKAVHEARQRETEAKARAAQLAEDARRATARIEEAARKERLNAENERQRRIINERERQRVANASHSVTASLRRATSTARGGSASSKVATNSRRDDDWTNPTNISSPLNPLNPVNQTSYYAPEPVRHEPVKSDDNCGSRYSSSNDDHGSSKSYCGSGSSSNDTSSFSVDP